MGPHHLRKNLPPSPLHTTRLDASHLPIIALASSATLYPRLAPGVEVITVGEERLGERIWVGGPVSGVEVTRHLRFFALDAPALRPSLFTALRALDGTRSIADLTTPLEIPTTSFARMLMHLESEGLIHLHSAPSVTKSSGKRDIGTLPTMTRREIEREHLPRSSSFLHRSQQSIAIVSDQASTISPLATSLAALLFGSGFNRIKFMTTSTGKSGNARNRRNPVAEYPHGESNPYDQISDRDLGLSIFNGTDVGGDRNSRLIELAHRSAILPFDESISGNFISDDFDATLTISMGYPRPDHHQRWLSEDRPFFVVPGYHQGEIRIGPIIIPGVTPCLRCHELNEMENNFWREQSRQLQQLQPTIDPPKVASHLIASLAALYATQWLDSVEMRRMDHLLVGKQYIFSLLPTHSLSSTLPLPSTSALDDGLCESRELPRESTFGGSRGNPWEESALPVRIERLQNHPECGCLWDLPRRRESARSNDKR